MNTNWLSYKELLCPTINSQKKLEKGLKKRQQNMKNLHSFVIQLCHDLSIKAYISVSYWNALCSSICLYMWLLIEDKAHTLDARFTYKLLFTVSWTDRSLACNATTAHFPVWLPATQVASLPCSIWLSCCLMTHCNWLTRRCRININLNHLDGLLYWQVELRNCWSVHYQRHS